MKPAGAWWSGHAPALAAAAIIALTAPLSFYIERGAPSARRADAARLMNDLMSGTATIGAPFTLTDPSGRRVSLADFRGKLVLLYFGYATCPDVCPTDLAILAQALRDLGAAEKHVQPIFVTLDPERDKPAVLREYAEAFHPRLVALTGTPGEVRSVATAYKVFYEKVRLPGSGTYAIDHTAYTFLLDREGRFLTLFPPGTPHERMVFMLHEQLQSNAGVTGLASAY